jgi:AGCS family alanine or glycine:cation symporter
VLGCLIVLATKIDLIPQAFGLIFGNAFNGTAVGGGLLGTVIRYGVANEYDYRHRGESDR